MAHPPRQYIEGYWYHVYARSMEEVCLFENEAERVWFVQELDDIFTRRQCQLGAICLLDTHYHALVKMGPVLLERVLNGLHMSYTKFINATRQRNGSLFDTRPGAEIILDDQYMLQLVPYIHQNPVKAGLVSSALDYKWSTDALYREIEPEQEALSFECWRFPPHFQGNDRRQVYKRIMGEEVSEPESSGGYYGSETEWEELDRRKESRADRYRERRGRKTMEKIAGEIAAENDLTVEDLRAPGRSQPEARLRQEAMVEMYEEGYGPKEIGDFFNRNKGTVVYAVKKSQG